jgi:TolA-binding protein
MLVFLLAISLAGCNDGAKTSGKKSGSSKSGGSVQNKDLFNIAIDSLNQFEQFQTAAVQGEINQKLAELAKKAAASAGDKESTLLAAWPQSDTLQQRIVDRLNRWIREQPPIQWKPDAMLAELPEPLRNLPPAASLDQRDLGLFDAYYLLEAVYLRDISLSARGKSIDDLSRAKNLFDWMIRNIQLDKDSPDRIPQFPWETIFFGHGSAEERDWVFVLLLRQQGLDAAVLAIEKDDDSPPKPWCVAVRIGDKAYLFDLEYGLAIPGPTGFQKNDRGQLDITPATLDQLASDESLLKRMSADADHPYKVAADDLKNVVALVEASPAALSRRMKIVESHLPGNQKMIVSASASEQAERWKSTPGVAAARLWQLPYETIRRRSELTPLQVASILNSFLPFYAMPSDLLHREEVLDKAAEKPADKLDIYHGAAAEKDNKKPQNAFDPMQDTDLQKAVRIQKSLSRFSATYAAPLYKGRVMQLKGKVVETGGDAGALAYYQMSRPSEDQLRQLQIKLLEEFVKASLPGKDMTPEEQEKLFKQVMDAILTGEEPGDKNVAAFAQSVQEGCEPFIRAQIALIVAGKLDASYWLGLVTFERGDYQTAIDYFYTRTLQAYPDGPWTFGARYNFGRTAEAMGKYAEAAKMFRSAAPAPDAPGQLLRAKWLEELNEKKADAEKAEEK